MKTFLRSIYLKIKELFPPKPKNHDIEASIKATIALNQIARALRDASYYDQKTSDEQLIEDLNRMQETAGILDWKNRVIREKAVNNVFHEIVQEKMEKLRGSKSSMDHLRSIAQTAANRTIEAEERANYYGIKMEKNKQAIFVEIAKIETQWKKYFVKSGDLEETAPRFAEFLVKKKFLSQKQVNMMNVFAVFIDGKIANPLNFHREMSHARLYYSSK